MKYRSHRLVLLLLMTLWAAPWAAAHQENTAGSDAAQIYSQGQPTQLPTLKRDSNKNDVEAIGNRKIGGKGVGNWYSIEKEVEMGKQYAEAVEESTTLLEDPVVTEYVNRIGQNLVHNSDAVVPFVIKVIDSNEVNAFALPGGFFYVNSGLILAANDEAELAGVMAHEIAHVAAHHAARQMTRVRLFNLASIPLIFVGGGVGYAIRAALTVGKPMAVLSFSRSFETEADYLGLQYMYKAGYDPQAFISFFERIKAQERKKPGTLAKAFADHPQTPARIKRSQQEISSILPRREQYIVTTSDFDSVKARLALIESRNKLIEKGNSNEPSLRRSGNTGNGDSQGDDPPTLKRRSTD
jgi:predicted Zn-dependent protease